MVFECVGDGVEERLFESEGMAGARFFKEFPGADQNAAGFLEQALENGGAAASGVGVKENRIAGCKSMLERVETCLLSRTKRYRIVHINKLVPVDMPEQS